MVDAYRGTFTSLVSSFCGSVYDLFFLLGTANLHLIFMH